TFRLSPVFPRSCRARSVLFVPARSDTPLESFALHGAEPCPRRHGEHAGSISLVKRRRSLWHGTARFGTAGRSVETAMGFHHVEAVSVRTRSRRGRRGDTAMYAHGSPARNGGVC